MNLTSDTQRKRRKFLGIILIDFICVHVCFIVNLIEVMQAFPRVQYIGTDGWPGSEGLNV